MKQLKQKDIKPLRDKLIMDQGGKCLICGCMLGEGASLDHHHKKKIKGSGQIRGVLCRSCNVYLGKIENNAPRYGIHQDVLSDRLKSISNYLKLPHLPYLHPSESPKKPILSKRCFNVLFKEYIKDKPKNIPIQYPKNGHLTKPLEKLFKKYNIKIIFNKN